MKNYIDENWPRSNSNPNVFYILKIEGQKPRHYYTVDDLQTAILQARRERKEITVSHRWERGSITIFEPETQQEKQDRENWELCRRIANKVEAYTTGTIRRCPDCEAEIQISETAGDKYCCPECRAVNDLEDWEQLSLWDYMEDILDMDWILNGRREYKACRIMVSFGGPNIYLDTMTGNVELYWWGDRASYRMTSEAVEAIDEWAEEYWRCI